MKKSMKKLIKRFIFEVLIYLLIIIVWHALFPEALKISTGISVFMGWLLADVLLQLRMNKKRKNDLCQK